MPKRERKGRQGPPRRPGERYPIELLHREVQREIAQQAKAKGTTSYAVIEEHFPAAYRRFQERRNGSKPSLDC